MAFKRGGHTRPQFSISTSVFVRKGKYLKGPSFGLWESDNGPIARGSVKEEYLDDLISFLTKAEKNEMSVSFALFKNDEKGGGKRGRDDDEGEYRSHRSRKDDDEDEEKPRRRKREEEDEDKPRGKKGGKKDDWGFDDD